MSPIDRIDKGLPLSVHLSCLNSLDRAGADMMLLRPRCFCLCIPVTPRFFVQNQIQNLIWETRYDRLSEDMTANKPKQAIFTAMLGHCWLCLNTVAHCATSYQASAAGDPGRDKIQDSQSISAPSNRAEVSRYKYKNKYVSWHCAHSDFEHGGGGRQCVDKIQDSQPYRCLKYWGPKICDATYHVLKGNLCL